MCPRSSRVSRSHWVSLLRGWLVSVDVMCFGGRHFLIIYYTVIHGDLDPYCFVRNPCILHLKAFVLNIVHILLCYFGRNCIFRV